MLRKFGGPDGFAVVEQPVPVPGPGEVLVKVLAASVQFTDVILRKGQYPDLKEKPPLVLGYDLVGEVVQLGPAVSSPSVGERVADMTVTGCYAQYRTLKADRVASVDAALDPAEATSLILSWTTAYQLLHRDARVNKGQKLLVLGAAGAVGQALVVLGKLAGCEVWGACRARHADLLRTLGAAWVDSDAADFGQLLPWGFDAVFDGIGEQGFSRAWAAVGPHGHLSAFGVSAGVAHNVSIARLGFWLAKLWWWNTFSHGQSARFFSVTSARTRHPDWFVADLGALLGMLLRGEIKPRVAQRIALDGVAEAHTRIERGGLEGKVILVPDG
jgi:NADPH:quinone reductase-like Zn-dependent oxidoreductase